MFNLTNPDEFLQGAKPKYDEIGPYVFTDTWEKDNVQWKNGDASIEYSQLRYFKFKPGPSKGQLRDEIIIPNIPMIVRNLSLNSKKDLHSTTFAIIFMF